ncbi:MAG: hypothetical protein WA765_11875 [Candidatus Acidiferrum sp.]
MYVQERPGGPGTQVLTMRRFLIFSASLAFLPAIISAQGRGMGRGMDSAMGHPAVSAPAMSHPAMAAPHFAMGSSPSVGTRYSYARRAHPGMHYVRTRSGAVILRPVARQTGVARTARDNRPILSEDVPGLGFDYAHVAGVHPNGPDGRGRGRGLNRGFVGAYFPFYGGGYYWPIFPDDVDDQQASAAPPEEAQPADTGEPVAEQVAENEAPVRPSHDYVPSKPAPPQDTDEYVFVRRDGTLFFAAAFAWENGTLRYITREGLRRTLPLDQLDLNATQQFNQQRGLNFRLPA